MLSTNPKQQCRFILLGGDGIATNDACRFILRTAQTQQVQRNNLGSCEMKENFVQGRHVCMVKSPFLWMDHLASFWVSFQETQSNPKRNAELCIAGVPWASCFSSDDKSQHWQRALDYISFLKTRRR